MALHYQLTIPLTLTDELKNLHEKIKANQAQYNLDRETASSPKELDKYEYLTGKDLGYKPGVVERAKLEYSLLGKAPNKGLEKYIQVKNGHIIKLIKTTMI